MSNTDLKKIISFGSLIEDVIHKKPYLDREINQANV
jgi:hypothetical protein